MMPGMAPGVFRNPREAGPFILLNPLVSGYNSLSFYY